MRAVAVLVPLAAFGCGRIGFDAAPDPNEGSTSGARLTLIWDEIDGARRFAGIYDTVLDMPCDLQNWGGLTYCMPRTSLVTFADATCAAEPLVFDDANASKNPYYVNLDWDACFQPALRLFRRGAPVSTTSYFHLRLGECFGPTSDGSTFATAIEIPMTTLATLDIERQAGSGRLVRQDYVSPDGFRLQTFPLDTALGASCGPARWMNGMTCSPIDEEGARYATDASCTMPLGVTTPTCETKYLRAQDACRSNSPTFYERGAVSSAAPLYAQNGSECVSATAPTGALIELGARVADPPVMVRELGTGSRVVPMRAVGGGMSVPFGFYDTLLDIECRTSQLAADGVRRCLPDLNTSGLRIPAFTDAACSSPIFVVQDSNGSGACPHAPPRYTAYATVGPSGDLVHIHGVGALHAGPLWSTVGGCTPMSTELVYDSEPESDPRDFVEAVELSE